MRPNIFITGFYKTGSTHLAYTLARLLSYPRASLVYAPGGFGDEDQRLDAYAADVLLNVDPHLYQHHIKATANNAGIIKHYGIKPIVMMRNVYDSMRSVRKRLDSMDPQHNRLQPSSEWQSMADEEKWLWIAYNVIPWYYTFFISWAKAELGQMYLWYESYFHDQVGGIRSVLAHLGMDDPKVGSVSDEVIAQHAHHFNANYTADRTVIEIPSYVEKIAEDQARGWGKEWEFKIRQDLLERRL